MNPAGRGKWAGVYFGELGLDVNNIADKSYFSSADYLGDPRSVAFSAQVRF